MARQLLGNVANMERFTIQGNWQSAKEQLKQRWPALRDEDLEYEQGRQDELVSRLQLLTGETRENLERTITEACKL